MEMKMMDKLKNLDEWNGNGEFQARTSAQGMMRAAEGAGTASGKETKRMWHRLRDDRSGKETKRMWHRLWCIRS